MAAKNQTVELLLAKKATKTYLEKLQTLSDQLAAMKHCLQKVCLKFKQKILNLYYFTIYYIDVMYFESFSVNLLINVCIMN